jgi:hypothetical protein
MAGIPTVVTVAAVRVESSHDPERFRWLVRDIERGLRDGHRLLDLATSAWTDHDVVLLAAQIEAMAGMRRVDSLSHPYRCKCGPCWVRSRLKKSRKDDDA